LIGTTLEALVTTLLWSSLAIVLVMVPGTLLAYILARFEFAGKRFVSTLFSLPLVLPPTAVGYLLLRLFASRGPLGRSTLGFDLDIILTWKAVVIACAVMATPLVVRTARVSFEGVDPRYEAMARTLGHGRIATFFRYTIPLASRGLLAAMILGFTRAMGEFGATIVLAGNIPGRTQTLSSAIFSAQQAGREDEANVLIVIALAIGFTAIFITEYLSSRRVAGDGGRNAVNARGGR
jgi:molybdate transport system permease protein